MSRKILTSLALLAFVVVSASAMAQTVPYKGRGQNAAFNPNDGSYRGPGIATHLGRCFLDGQLKFTPTPPEPNPPFPVFLNGTFIGEQDLIAANGDRVRCSVTGSVTLYFNPTTGLAFGTWLPEFEVTQGSTGRFANASGKFSGTAVNPPFNPNDFTRPWPFNWAFDGKINLGKKGKKK